MPVRCHGVVYRSGVPIVSAGGRRHAPSRCCSRPLPVARADCDVTFLTPLNGSVFNYPTPSTSRTSHSVRRESDYMVWRPLGPKSIRVGRALLQCLFRRCGGSQKLTRQLPNSERLSGDAALQWQGHREARLQLLDAVLVQPQVQHGHLRGNSFNFDIRSGTASLATPSSSSSPSLSSSPSSSSSPSATTAATLLPVAGPTARETAGWT